MEEFLKIKVNRAIWVSLLSQKKLVEAYSAYEGYIKSINSYIKKFASNKSKFKQKQEAEDEINFSNNLYCKTLKELSKEFLDNKDYANALICYTGLFTNDKNFDEFRGYLLCVKELKQLDLQVDLLKHFENSPQKPSFYKFIAELYSDGKNYEKAVKYLEKYIHTENAVVTGSDYNLLGCYYNNLYSNVRKDPDILEKSKDNFLKAYEVEPCRLFIRNAIIMTEKAERADLSRKYWQIILDNYEMTNDDKYDYAAFCLKNSDFDGWHKYFDFRFLKEHNATPFPKDIKKPKWDGITDLSDKTLLIHSEQGFGDTFLMFGYFPRLIEKVKKLIFIVQKPACDLLKNSGLNVEIYAEHEVDLDTLDFDYYLPSMSIPIALKYKRDDLKVGGGYIKADKNLSNEFKNRYFDNDKFKIGISYFGNSAGNHSRDIPVPKFLPLDDIDGIELYCINKDVPDSVFCCFKNNRVHNIGKDFKNFQDTAAAIDNLDLVITSDNGILNLAGAMGKKTFALFNVNIEFRWFDLTGDNVVYYDSVKPFVNEKVDGWEDSIEKVINELKEILEAEK